MHNNKFLFSNHSSFYSIFAFFRDSRRTENGEKKSIKSFRQTPDLQSHCAPRIDGPQGHAPFPPEKRAEHRTPWPHLALCSLIRQPTDSSAPAPALSGCHGVTLLHSLCILCYFFLQHLHHTCSPCTQHI